MTADSLFFVERDSKAWNEAWEGLTKLYGAPSQPCSCCGEDWQYHGHEVTRKRVVAAFRHRHHPAYQNSGYIRARIKVDSVQAVADRRPL